MLRIAWLLPSRSSVFIYYIDIGIKCIHTYTWNRHINIVRLYGISQFIKNFSHITSFHHHSFFSKKHIFSSCWNWEVQVSKRLNNLTKRTKLKINTVKTGYALGKASLLKAVCLPTCLFFPMRGGVAHLNKWKRQGACCLERQQDLSLFL